MASRGMALLLASLGIAVASCQVTAPTGAAPLYVAIVRLNELAPYSSAADGGVNGTGMRPAAAALRAAGYPSSPWLSAPLLRRTADVAGLEEPVPLPGETPQLGSAVPLGPGGPSLQPAAANASSSSSSSSAAGTRRLAASSSSSSSTPQQGLRGLSTRTPAGTSALAVGPAHLLQASGGVVRISNLSSETGEVLQGSDRSVALSALLAGAAAGCLGVYDPSAAYDAAAGRFLLSATCGGRGRALLAASATPDPAAAWFVFALVADGANSSLACTSPVAEAAVLDYTQVSFNADGVFVTHKSVCPSNTSVAGAGIIALPKYAVYKGMVNFVYPLYGPAELAAALGNTGTSQGATSCAQLAPVLPQGAADVAAGAAYFVCEQPIMTASTTAPNKVVTIAALLDTAALWQYGGPASNTSSPMMAAAQLTLAAAAPPGAGMALRQPDGAPPLHAGAAPKSFWNGAAVLFGGKLYLASPTLVSGDKSSPNYSRRPAITWAEVALSPAVTGTEQCAQSKAGAASLATWDWQRDYSVNWGSEFDLNFTQQANASFPARLASAASPGGSTTVIKAAAVSVGQGLSLLWGTTLHAQPCSCYRCYWGGSYYRYGGYQGGALAGSSYGYAANNYYFTPQTMTRCQTTCTFCWYAGYPGYGFGNTGSDLLNNIPNPGRVRGINGQLTDANATSEVDALAGVSLSSLFTPCSRSASLGASLVRQGVVTQAGEQPLGLAFPALAVSRDGQLLLAFSYAGPGNVTGATPAFVGMGAAIIPPGATSASGIEVVRAGRGTIQPAAALPGTSPSQRGEWAELSAAGVHPTSGRIFAAAHYAPSAAPLSSDVGTWIASWTL